jgi:hypothetical protein
MVSILLNSVLKNIESYVFGCRCSIALRGGLSTLGCAALVGDSSMVKLLLEAFGERWSPWIYLPSGKLT